QIHIIGELLHQ
ncbi:hypothetical protein D031_3767B, partial [Vibrio parahaemolyticus VP-48]